MDSMYEINRRSRRHRRPRPGQAREENTFKSIPDLSRAEAEPEAGLYSLYCARSLGYIPGPGLETADTAAEAWSRARTPATRRRGGEERDRQLWSKSSEQLGGAEAWQRWAPVRVLQRYHLATYTESYAANLPLRYQRPGAAPGGGGESYQHNYVVKDQYEPVSLPFPGPATLPRPRAAAPPPLLLGVLRYRRDSLFSRWSERTLVLTYKFLKCYDRAASAAPPRAKPQVLWKIKLDSIEHMDLVTRRGQLTIKLLVHGDGAKLLLRGAPEDTRHWFNMIMGCCNQSVAAVSAEAACWEPHPHTQRRSESIQRWLLGRPTIAAGANQPQSLQYQHQPYHDIQDYQSWHPDYQTYATTNTLGRRNYQRPETALSRKPKSSKEKKMFKHESQDSGNSSLSTPTLSSPKTKYASQLRLKYAN